MFGRRKIKVGWIFAGTVVSVKAFYMEGSVHICSNLPGNKSHDAVVVNLLFNTRYAAQRPN